MTGVTCQAREASTGLRTEAGMPDELIYQSETACCPRETIPDSCSCPDDCDCMCLDCICGAWGEEYEDG